MQRRTAHASKQSGQIMPLRSAFISLLRVAASFSERDEKECVLKDAHELQAGDVAKKKHGSATQTNVKTSATGTECDVAPGLQSPTLTVLQSKLTRGFEGQVRSIPG